MAHHFQAFVPSNTQPFDAKAAAHLLRRAGFGAPPEEVAAAVEAGLESTVDRLFDPAEVEEAEFQRAFDSAGGLVNFGDVGYVQGWWVHRMLHSRVPLREKLTLFWHGHFATSSAKVETSFLMHRQLATIRSHALGSFRDLVLAIAQDPAMLVYLDGESNTKEHPNENFARELMELFTCGIGHYSEKDVQEAARAFSGWHREGTEFVFRAEVHDTGWKEFLKHGGRFDGTDIIDLLMQLPATPRRIARQLLRFFAEPEPSPEVVDEAAELLVYTQLNIKWFLRSLFSSKYFYSERCYRRRIASPAEYVVGTARTLRARISGVELKDHISSMGQELLAPPNVKGWDGEQLWINSNWWPHRLEYAEYAANVSSDDPWNPNVAIERLVPLEMNDPSAIIDRLAQMLLQGELSQVAKNSLVELLTNSDDGPDLESFRADEGVRQQRTRAALATMLALPEYQAC